MPLSPETYSAGKHIRHWARNIIKNKTGDKIYIAVGSGSNVAEEGLFMILIVLFFMKSTLQKRPVIFLLLFFSSHFFINEYMQQIPAL